jgi:XTP/dITP diphosphohydrolase
LAGSPATRPTDWRRLLLATSNPGKLDEIRDALAGVTIELVTLAELTRVPEPEETGATFADNARLKALYYADRYGLPAVAEDSGLVIDAMNGEPGVRSARFLGADASYAERFAEIERRLAPHPEASRTARFVCAAVIVADREVAFEATGAVDGVIADTPAGSNGFGYDPIFFYPPYNATFGEVSKEAKLRVSHRGRTFRQVAAWLRNPG